MKLAKAYSKIRQLITDPGYRFMFFSSYGIFRFMADEKFIKYMYWAKFGTMPDLNAPKTFNEKIQWLKINDRNPLYSKLANKYEAKQIIGELIGREHIIPLIGVWNSVEDIDLTLLPKEFVLKCTHDSGSILICRDKSRLTKKEIKQKIGRPLKRNYYYCGREWPYKDIQPRVIAEQYLEDESGCELKDYKFFVFRGKVKCVQVDMERFTDHRRNFYDCDWNFLPIEIEYPMNPGCVIQKPEQLEQMILMAEQISESIGTPAFVRVDFYSIRKKVFFGEVTFFPGAGWDRFSSKDWDQKMGDWLELESFHNQTNNGE